jgi:hypothetical protein
MQPKVVITGTGRSGTSFLVQLLTQLRQDTGFRHAHEKWDEATKRGLEWDVWDYPWNRLPRFIKDPRLSTRLKELLGKGFLIEHVLVPVRSLEEAAESRLRRKVQWGDPDFKDADAVGGLKNLLAQVLGQLTADLITLDIPHTFLKYPLLAQDGDYLWEKISFLLTGVKREIFLWAFDGLSYFRRTDEQTTPAA